MAYRPSAPVVVDATTRLPRNNSTSAPETGLPLDHRDTTPVTVPSVMTVKGQALLVRPLTVTRTGPVVAPWGTGTAIDVALHDVGAATTPLNVVRLEPCVAPKLDPAIAIELPTMADEGERLAIEGVSVGSGTVMRES